MKTRVLRAKKGIKDKSKGESQTGSAGGESLPPVLTPKQKAMLDFILEFRAERGYAPSQHEIAAHFGFSSLGTVQNYLVRLERQGAIQKDWNARRGTHVLQDRLAGPTSHADVIRAPVSNAKVSEETGGELSLPLLGWVAAGRPIEAIENREMVEVPRALVGRNGEHFVLRVQGDSMIEEGILDGDQVIIKKQRTAQNGQTVVALVGNEATIKKYYFRQGRVELHPANPKYSPLIVDADVKDEFHIEGVMVGLIRKF
ncbi:MAG TPA: transcriptional repressor LexA [Bdellovibrionales bacterium]|nr:transcriptional repressor LexA [Bdellovibrionales bacterium]